jgi:purine-binding chemotaxis protein CheW
MTAPSPVEAAKAILRARARALARPVATQRTSETTIEVVEFRLAHERYAIEQAYVREIYPFRDLTPLPCVQPFFLGIINIRGQIVPVLDIRRFFDLPECGITDLHTVIVFDADDTEMGILADAVVGARSIGTSAIQTSLPTLTGIRSTYLKGVADGSLVVLDAQRIIADPAITMNEEAT